MPVSSFTPASRLALPEMPWGPSITEPLAAKSPPAVGFERIGVSVGEGGASGTFSGLRFEAPGVLALKPSVNAPPQDDVPPDGRGGPAGACRGALTAPLLDGFTVLMNG
ncbi:MULTISPECIES: hypothetical protein [unclassified Corallococcus]|uniref:hypothetical protein n=1 Tax=unclassified Corallococcus TaxID=2685029 RepID=UPI001A90383D|nr:MULTISPECIES: hypothetical protein [unclassified Corallococcus]MBN9685629.1 hypothetical protein [Corallococcus sp. NCSPR001]WAS82925.1 hypothetical protein O0N60_26800 [Corallococcus sp. NCRR]